VTTAGGRTRRGSKGEVRKTPFVNALNNEPTAPTRDRAATFVQDSDLSSGKGTTMSGTANTVTRAKLKSGRDPIVGDDRTVFFKAHDATYSPSQYAVAATRMAEFLRMPRLIAHNAFGRIQGKQGVVSGRVPGKPLISSEHLTERQVPEGYDKRDIAAWVQNAQLIKRNGKYYSRSAMLHEWLNLADPAIQKGLSDLQLFDALTGQRDRHGGNIYVDPDTGAVTGIDDDQSFGRGQPPSAIAERTGKYLGLPELVDRNTAQQILAVHPNSLAAALRSQPSDGRALSTKEITQARERLLAVQEHLRGLERDGRLVTTWNDATYAQALQQPDRSYLGRHAADINDGFAGKILDAGSIDQIEMRVRNAPPGVTAVPVPQLPPLPVPVPVPVQPPPQPAWGVRPDQRQARTIPNRLALSRNVPFPQPRAVTTADAGADSPRIAATTRMLAERVDPLPEGDDDSTDATDSFGERTLVNLSGDDEVFPDATAFVAESGGDRDPVEEGDERTDRSERDQWRDSVIIRLQDLLEYVSNEKTDET
jgi:hypothetical protein